jgi:hypothetical protein
LDLCPSQIALPLLLLPLLQFEVLAKLPLNLLPLYLLPELNKFMQTRNYTVVCIISYKQ